MAIQLPKDLSDTSERKSIDLESLPDSRTPKWLRSARPNRRGLIIGGLLVALVPAIFLTMSQFGFDPVAYTSLPSERPADMSLCDYYALKKFYGNSASTQKQLVQAIVDKAFVGAKNPEKYFGTESGMFNGILRPGDMWEVPLDMTKYFDGSSDTTNVDGKASRVSFFTGKNFTQYGREYPEGNSRFHSMMEGMYKYFAPMLGCSIYGNTVDRYTSTRSMKDIHKFMKLDDPKNWDWKYFFHQFTAGTLAAGFSQEDSGLFEAYLIDTFGPKLDKKNKKYVGCFENPALTKSDLPPTFDIQKVIEHREEITEVFVPNYAWKRSEGEQHKAPFHMHVEKARRDNAHHLHRRQDFSSKPPPLTTPDLATATRTAVPTASESSSAVPPSVLPVALGAGIGAGLGVIAIGIAIAYLVIRKKRLAKRQSIQSVNIKTGHIEMQRAGKDRTTTTTQRVDRSEHGNAVGGKSKHKKNQSQRSVTFEP